MCFRVDFYLTFSKVRMWVSDISLSLVINKDMRYFLLFGWLLGFLSVQAQDEIIREPRGSFISVSPGVWMPLGKLRKTFDVSPQFRVGLSGQWERLKVDVGVDFVMNNGNRPFRYTGSDTSFVAAKNLTLGGLGLSVGHIDRLSPVSYLEKSFGIGYTSISTGEKKLKSECGESKVDVWHFGQNECEGNKKYDFLDVESFYLSAGVGLQRIVFKKRVFGVHTEYRFTPFSWFGKVKKGFGNSSLSTNFTFRF